VEDLSVFLNMGGHAAFVWSALGITAVVLVGIAIASVRRLRRSELTLNAAEAAAPARRRQNEPEAGS